MFLAVNQEKMFLLLINLQMIHVDSYIRNWSELSAYPIYWFARFVFGISFVFDLYVVCKSINLLIPVSQK